MGRSSVPSELDRISDSRSCLIGACNASRSSLSSFEASCHTISILREYQRIVFILNYTHTESTDKHDRWQRLDPSSFSRKLWCTGRQLTQSTYSTTSAKPTFCRTVSNSIRTVSPSDASGTITTYPLSTFATPSPSSPVDSIATTRSSPSATGG